MSRNDGWVVLLLLVSFPRLPDAKELHPGPCLARETSIVVDVEKRRLWLCKANEVSGEFPVALGRKGAGKRLAGDDKTPVGDYSLGEPRPSKQFGTFIPIGYPTEQQRKRGATGKDVGLHGPLRDFAWVGRATTSINWTRGCIAVGSDDDIDEIARWIESERPSSIHIG